MSICPSGNLTYRCLTLSIIVLALVLMTGIPNSAKAQDLLVAVGDTSGSAGELNSVITTYLTNYEDEIVAIEMWIYLEREEIMYFQTEDVVTVDTTWWKCLEWDGETCIDYVSASPIPTYWICLANDTIEPFGCIDSIRVQEGEPYEWMIPVDTSFSVINIDTVTIGAIDTVGTLLGGWEKVTTRSFIANDDSSKFYDVKIIAQANANWGDGVNTPGIPAGQQGGVLFRLLADIENIDDTVTERSVGVNIYANPADNFVFTRPNGTVIGLAYNQFIDSNFYRCDAWDYGVSPPECYSWTRVSTLPWDSVVVFPDSQAYIDTMVIDTITWLPSGQVEITNGELTVLLFEGVCGNTSGDIDGLVDLADITRLIGSVYLGGPEADPPCLGNTNCDSEGLLDLADITKLIDHVYVSKAPLCPDCCTY